MYTLDYILTLYLEERVAETSQIYPRDTFYQNDLVMKNSEDVTGGKPIAISGVSAVSFLVAFYDIHGRKGEVLFLSWICFRYCH
jgi:hypothetical protein